MDLQISKNELLDALTCVEKAIKKATMSILETILIKSTGTEIIFEATCLDFGIRTSIPCIAEAGSICINAKQLLEIIRKMPDTDIAISTDDKYSVTLKAGKKINFKIAGNDPKQFPVLKEEEGDSITVSGGEIKNAVKAIAFCASTDETNKLMTGIDIKISETNMSLAALDGHRVGIRTITLPVAVKEPVEVIVPAEYMKEIVKILPSEDVEMILSKERVLLKTSSMLITTRLLDGEYYKIEQLLPTTFSTVLTVNRTNLLSAIDRSSLIISASDKRPVALKIEDNNMIISCISGIGKAKEEVEITLNSGDKIVIGFNPRFLMDMLQAITEDEVTLRLTGNERTPLYVTDEQKTYQYIVLPVRIVNVEE